ncbi:MAG: hypothetical protein HYV13_01395 [Candidatus Doudnabacteria bacterium]|nr:hypothetical protein [Candidatus Doudnabacteria bacterium]
MLHKISPVILSILLVVALLGSSGNLPLMGASIVVLAAVATFINYKRLGFYWSHLLLPIFFLVGAAGTYAVIPSQKPGLIFLILAGISFFYLERTLGKESHYLQNIFLLTVFLIYLGLFASAFYFVNFSFWWEIALITAFTVGLTLQGFAGITLPSKKYFFLLITVVIAESAVGLMLWPTHFLVNAIVLFLIFYLLWAFALAAFFGKLTSKKIYWQSMLVTLVLAAVLATASWMPLFE